MQERTCVIIKPDGVCKRLVGKVIDRLETNNLKISAMKMLKFDRVLGEKFYAQHKGKPFFEPFMQFLTSAPVIVMVVEGENAIAQVRTLAGDTDSRTAAPGTLRRTYGTDNRRNLIHSSDSTESFIKESQIIFPVDSIYEYKDTDWDV